MTVSLPALAAAFLAGGGLGAFYMAGLWQTTRRLASARRPVALLLASFAGRAGVLLVALWWLSQGRAPALAAALAGFVAARLAAVHWVRRGGAP